jgi:hypothetical protein
MSRLRRTRDGRGKKKANCLARSAKKVLSAAAKRARIQVSLGWHTPPPQRPHLDETGPPLGVQQKLMRYANISTTMNVCGGAFMEAKSKANTPVVQRALLQDRGNKKLPSLGRTLLWSNKICRNLKSKFLLTLWLRWWGI